MTVDERLEALVEDRLSSDGRLVVLSGAGISAESGIPTFRGADGFWTVGSTVYQPQEIATFEFFMREPPVTWAWYLHRRAACHRARPNAAHLALVELESLLGDRFTLVTQNVDGLHRRAGSGPTRLLEIHGNLDRVRCSANCGGATWPVPARFDDWEDRRQLDAEELDLLACPHCAARGRPHVLWFDEFYDETNFHFYGAQNAAAAATLLVVVGTTGATNLPMRMAEIAAGRGTAFIDVNIEDNVFRRHAASDPRSLVLDGPASHWLPRLAAAVARRAGSS
ncbi:MAG: RNA polymerase subunit sigma [Planctomycetes bacterium]|nr:RNA polymerase subunit sigma [Planctomycetota bacterium]